MSLNSIQLCNPTLQADDYIPSDDDDDDHPHMLPSQINSEFTHDIFIPTFSSLAKSIRTSSRSLRNRLKSIHHDGLFIREVANCPAFKTSGWSIPVMANRRAGEWYVRQDGNWYDYAGTCYFKSTDGHFGNWAVSTRRLNLNVLEILRKGERGVIIVDSTRRGKRFPDSFSKTIPIWLTTLNHLFFPFISHLLYTPPFSVSSSEHSQIVARIPSFVSTIQSLGINWSALPYKPSKPLRPIFVTPESPLPHEPWEYKELDFIPVILVTASRMVNGEGIEGEYIQGAGDDAENWLNEEGLTPRLFWKWYRELLDVNTDEQLTEKLNSLQKERLANLNGETGIEPKAHLTEISNDWRTRTGTVQIKPTCNLFVHKGTSSRSSVQEIGTAIMFTEAGSSSLALVFDRDRETQPLLPASSVTIPIDRSLLSSNNTKRSSKILRTQILPNIHAFFTSLKSVEETIRVRKNILIIWPVAEYGEDVIRDIVCASALIVCCILYNERGNIYEEEKGEVKPIIDKEYIRRRLTWVITSLSTENEEVNVSRASLLAVNSVLMS